MLFLKNKKLLIVVLIVSIAVLIPCCMYGGMFFTHFMIVNSTPDTSDWVLVNDDYIVCPVISDDNVTFYVTDKNGNTIFNAEQGWRDWDFKYINIDENNVITALSGDTGEYIYKFDGNGSFYLYSPNY